MVPSIFTQYHPLQATDFSITFKISFDSTLIFRSLSSRLRKEAHVGLAHLHRRMRKISINRKELYYALQEPTKAIGLLLVNGTSQLFAHMGLHELEDFVKQQLCGRYYLRYGDDFIFLSSDKTHLKHLIVSIREFLIQHL